MTTKTEPITLERVIEFIEKRRIENEFTFRSPNIFSDSFRMAAHARMDEADCILHFAKG